MNTRKEYKLVKKQTTQRPIQPTHAVFDNYDYVVEFYYSKEVAENHCHWDANQYVSEV